MTRAHWSGLLLGILAPLCVAVPWWAFGAGIIETILRRELDFWTLWVFPVSYFVYFFWGRRYKNVFGAMAFMSLASLFGPSALRLLFDYDCIPAYCTGYVNNLFNIGCGEAESGCFIEGFILFFSVSLLIFAIFLAAKKYKSFPKEKNHPPPHSG